MAATAIAPTDSVLTVRVPMALKSEIERDAKTLGVSTADAIRFRLRSGRVPTTFLGEEKGD
jgi:hypothetical protein